MIWWKQRPHWDLDTHDGFLFHDKPGHSRECPECGARARILTGVGKDAGFFMWERFMDHAEDCALNRKLQEELRQNMFRFLVERYKYVPFADETGGNQ